MDIDDDSTPPPNVLSLEGFCRVAKQLSDVVDLPVPPKLVKILPVVGGVRYEEKSEMTKTRYTAVTCDPDEFERRGFFLRQNELGRTTELFIVITMYNARPLPRLSFRTRTDAFCAHRKTKSCSAAL